MSFAASVVGYAHCLGEGAVVPVLESLITLFPRRSSVYPGGSAGRANPNR